MVDPGRKDAREADHRELWTMDRGHDNNDNTYSKVLEGHQEVEKHNKELMEKFRQHKKEIDLLPTKPEAFKTHQLPLARIKKIMKSDEDVKVASNHEDDLSRGADSVRQGVRAIHHGHNL